MSTDSPSASSAQDELADLAVAYARGVAAHLAEAHQRGESALVQLQHERWIRNDDHFRRTAAPQYYLRVGYLESAPLYQRLIDAVAGDEIFGPRLGQLLGTRHAGYMRFDADDVVGIVAGTLSRDDGSVLFDEAKVRRALADLRTDLTNAVQTSTLLIPLVGLRLSGRLELQPGLELVTFTDDEVALLAGVGLLQPEIQSMPLLWGTQHSGVRVTFETPIGIAPEQSDATGRDAEQDRPRVFGYYSAMRTEDLVEDVLSSLRIASRGSLFAPGHLLETRHFRGGSASAVATRPGSPFPSGEYIVDDAVGRRIQRMWRLLGSPEAAGNKIPMIALRRYNAAADRHGGEDAVVDLVIAIEALLSRDLAKDRSELSYRMALRGSSLLAKAGRQRRESFLLLRAGYDLRSKIAHGSEIPAQVSVRGGKGDTEVSAFVGELTDLVRDLIAQAAIEASEDPEFGSAAYWDTQLFGDG